MKLGRSVLCSAARASPLAVWTFAGTRSRGSPDPCSGVVEVTTASYSGGAVSARAVAAKQSATAATTFEAIFAVDTESHNPTVDSPSTAIWPDSSRGGASALPRRVLRGRAREPSEGSRFDWKTRPGPLDGIAGNW